MRWLSRIRLMFLIQQQRRRMRAMQRVYQDMKRKMEALEYLSQEYYQRQSQALTEIQKHPISHQKEEV